MKKDTNNFRERIEDLVFINGLAENIVDELKQISEFEDKANVVTLLQTIAVKMKVDKDELGELC